MRSRGESCGDGGQRCRLNSGARRAWPRCRRRLPDRRHERPPRPPGPPGRDDPEGGWRRAGSACTVAPCGDGGDADAAQFAFPVDVLPRPDGSYLVSDIGFNSNVVRRVDTSATPQIDRLLARTAPRGQRRQRPRERRAAQQPLRSRQHGRRRLPDRRPGQPRRFARSTPAARSARWRAPAPGGFSGDGGPAASAQLNDPVGVVGDGGRRLLHLRQRQQPRSAQSTRAARSARSRARRPNGAGGDGGPAAQAQLDTPSGIAQRDSTLFVADRFSSTVRAIGLPSTPTGVGGPGRVAAARSSPRSSRPPASRPPRSAARSSPSSPAAPCWSASRGSVRSPR